VIYVYLDDLGTWARRLFASGEGQRPT
jgi:hypothetical protein